MPKLNAEARQTLQNAGITPRQWATIQGFPEGKWYGDACGCNDDRCIGYHHEKRDECQCLPAMIGWHWENEHREGRGNAAAVVCELRVEDV